MVCDLDKTEGKTCILQSPLIPDTFSWSCMLITYQLSSDDVKLTLDLLSNGVSNVSYVLLANQSYVWVLNENLGSSVSVQFRASRYSVSSRDYEYGFVSSVSFHQCSSGTGNMLSSLPRKRSTVSFFQNRLVICMRVSNDPTLKP